MGHSRRQGHILSTADGMIAAIAFRHQGELATPNVDDFVLLNLVVHNPWTDWAKKMICPLPHSGRGKGLVAKQWDR